MKLYDDLKIRNKIILPMIGILVISFLIILLQINFFFSRNIEKSYELSLEKTN